MKALLKWKKAWSAVLLVALLMLFMSAPAFASTAIDTNKLGSITINLSASDAGPYATLSGIRFTVYQVAGLSKSGTYYLTNDFLASGLQLDKLSTAYEASAASKSLSNYVSAKQISGISDVTNSNGTVTFQNLTLGYYLVLQSYNPSNPNVSLICDPFLVAVPMKTSTDSNWVYNIVTNSKSESSCGAVILDKVNSSGSFLANAMFRLERKVYAVDIAHVPTGVQTGSDSGGIYYWSTMISSLITDSFGQLAVTGIPYGQYRFIETSPPAGYILDSTPHIFTISDKGSIALVNGKYVVASGSVQTITAFNFYNPPNSYPPYYPPPNSSNPPISSTPSTPATSSESSASSNESSGTSTALTSSIENTAPSNSGFNFPKTGGSIFYAVCTYGGLILMVCGIALFVISRKKKK